MGGPALLAKGNMSKLAIFGFFFFCFVACSNDDTGAVRSGDSNEEDRDKGDLEDESTIEEPEAVELTWWQPGYSEERFWNELDILSKRSFRILR